MSLIRHFARLPAGLVMLWLFFVWYLVMVALHFEASPRLWLNSLAMSAIVGSALMLSVRQSADAASNFWRVFRLYAIPFCVSSFSALVRDSGFYAIFAPAWPDNLAAISCCAVFLGWIGFARWFDGTTNRDKST